MDNILNHESVISARSRLAAAEATLAIVDWCDDLDPANSIRGFGGKIDSAAARRREAEFEYITACLEASRRTAGKRPSVPLVDVSRTICGAEYAGAQIAEAFENLVYAIASARSVGAASDTGSYHLQVGDVFVRWGFLARKLADAGLEAASPSLICSMLSFVDRCIARGAKYADEA